MVLPMVAFSQELRWCLGHKWGHPGATWCAERGAVQPEEALGMLPKNSHPGGTTEEGPSPPTCNTGTDCGMGLQGFVFTAMLSVF